MPEHTIFNLTSNEDTFDCAGYRFQRLPDYEEKLPQLYRKARVERDLLSHTYQQIQERPGLMLPTYRAHWSGGPGSEPPAVIHMPDCELVFDVLLLWSLWGGEYVGSGVQIQFQSPTHHGYPLIDDRRTLCREIGKVLAELTDSGRASALGLNPGLFLLLESMRTSVVNYQGLFVSPVIDLLASHESVTPWTAEQEGTLDELKTAILGELERLAPKDPAGDPLWRNVVKPLQGSVNGLGRPGAVEKLVAFLRCTPALQDIDLHEEVLESHARAFNQFRNSTLHYAGLPRRVRLCFGSGRTAVVKRKTDRDRMLLGLVYYLQAFKHLLQLHFFRVLGVSYPPGEHNYSETIERFFVDGLFNGQDWLTAAFKDSVEILK